MVGAQEWTGILWIQFLTMTSMHQIQLKALGFPYPEYASLLIEGGSKLHGTKLEGKDDTDWYGLYVEPAEIALGLDKLEHFVHTTGGTTVAVFRPQPRRTVSRICEFPIGATLQRTLKGCESSGA